MIPYKDNVLLKYHGHLIDRYEIIDSNLKFCKRYYYQQIDFMKQFFYKYFIYFVISPNSNDIEIVQINENKVNLLDRIITDRGKIMDVIGDLDEDIIAIKRLNRKYSLNIYTKVEITYQLFDSIKEMYDSLYNIIPNFFLACNNYKIDVYELYNHYLELKKTIHGCFSFLGNIDNKFFVLRENNYLYIIDVIYFQIIQKIQTNSCLIALKDNYLLQINTISKFDVNIQISKYDLIEGYFKFYKSINKNIKSNDYLRLKYIGKNNYGKHLFIFYVDFYDEIKILI